MDLLAEPDLQLVALTELEPELLRTEDWLGVTELLPVTEELLLMEAVEEGLPVPLGDTEGEPLPEAPPLLLPLAEAHLEPEAEPEAEREALELLLEEADTEGEPLRDMLTDTVPLPELLLHRLAVAL
jgi:hypothetical protein